MRNWVSIHQNSSDSDTISPLDKPSNYQRFCRKEHYEQICTILHNPAHFNATSLRLRSRRSFEMKQLLARSAFLLSGFLAAALWSQTSEATVSGEVLDPSGAAVPDTAISAENVQTGVASR